MGREFIDERLFWSCEDIIFNRVFEVRKFCVLSIRQYPAREYHYDLFANRMKVAYLPHQQFQAV